MNKPKYHGLPPANTLFELASVFENLDGGIPYRERVNVAFAEAIEDQFTFDFDWGQVPIVGVLDKFSSEEEATLAAWKCVVAIDVLMQAAAQYSYFTVIEAPVFVDDPNVDPGSMKSLYEAVAEIVYTLGAIKGRDRLGAAGALLVSLLRAPDLEEASENLLAFSIAWLHTLLVLGPGNPGLGAIPKGIEELLGVEIPLTEDDVRNPYEDVENDKMKATMESLGFSSPPKPKFRNN